MKEESSSYNHNNTCHLNELQNNIHAGPKWHLEHNVYGQ